MNGKLENSFIATPYFTNFYNPLTEDDLVQFEDFYDVISKWAVSPEQTELSYEDFAASEDAAGASGMK